jgi:16S rRNA (uracil1498-N3)-methyltransferase
MEWFIEKAVEIGIHNVTFIHTTNSERKNINLDRIRKKAISAMKQSVRAYLPEINPLEEFDDLVGKAEHNQCFIAHLKDIHTPYLHHSATAASNYLILIGPEGGFTQAEINLAQQKNFEMVKIGNHRLRTETAGIVACSILNQINQL